MVAVTSSKFAAFIDMHMAEEASGEFFTGKL